MAEIVGHGRRKAALAFIFVTAVLDVLALGVIIPVLPKLVQSFVQGDTVTAVKVYGVFGTVFALMQFIFSPILGSLSDRFGRRPIVLISNFGMAADYVLMALAPSIGWLFVGRILSGITASSMGTAGAYIADVTPPEKRAQSFGMLGAAFGIGFILGPALGGLIGGIDPRAPFWAAAALSFLNAVYGTFVLPESLPKDRRTPFSWRRANPLGSLKLLRAHKGLLGLASMNFLMNVSHAVYPSIFVLFAGYRYGWDERDVGLSLAAFGVAAMIVQGGLVQPIVTKLGERKTLLLGLICGSIGFATFGLAPNGSAFFIGLPFGSLAGIAGAAVQGLMSKCVGSEEQGQLQGANSSLFGVAELIGPGLFTFTFAVFINENGPKIPGAPWFLASAIVAAAFGVALYVTRKEEPAPMAAPARESGPAA